MTIEREIDDRQNQRDATTGVINRMGKANEQNQQDSEAMGQRMVDRQNTNRQRAADRQAGIDETQAELDATTGEQKQLQKDRSLADVLLDQLAETTDMDEMNTLIEMLNQMRRDGVLSKEQDERFDTNVGIASNTIDQQFKDEDRKEAAKDGAGNAESTLAKGATQGTFSAFGAIMGIGRNDEIMLLEQIAANTDATAKKPEPQFGS